jgi:hypothetical protein
MSGQINTTIVANEVGLSDEVFQSTTQVTTEILCDAAYNTISDNANSQNFSYLNDGIEASQPTSEEV